jgi:hypothetical protein
MDTQIGLLGEKYSLALDDGSAFNSYNLMLTNLLLYLANVISHDFFIHFGTSFSPSARLKMSREKSVSREMSPLTEINSYYLTIFPPFCRNQERILEYLVLRKPNMKECVRVPGNINSSFAELAIETMPKRELKSETNLQMHKDTSSSTDFLVRYPIQFGILLAVVQVLHSLLPNLQCRVPVV